MSIDTWVYFAHCGQKVTYCNSGYVKIGKSADPQKRMLDIKYGRTSVVVPADADLLGMEAIGMVYGPHELEADLHTRFGYYRCCGEWFYADADILEEIRSLHGFQQIILPSDYGYSKRTKSTPPNSRKVNLDRLFADTRPGTLGDIPQDGRRRWQIADSVEWPNREYFSINQVAAVLGVSTRTVYEWARNGTLAGTQRGRNWMIPRESLVTK